MIIRKESQRGLMLKYMQETKNKVPCSLFINPSIFSKVPLIGYSANTRMSDLKRMGLVTVSEEKIKGVKKFFLKSRDRNIYTITDKGLNFKLT